MILTKLISCLDFSGHYSNLKQNLYNVVDDCSMRISNGHDKVFLSEMNARDIQNFNRDTHMIECTYSKPNGVMHDCKIKMI